MLRRYLVVIFTALFLSAIPGLAWKFASIADSRGSNNGVNTAELTTIINRVNAENVDMLIFQGDAITGTCADSCISSQMDTWLSIMRNLNCPWYYTCGNHEIYLSTSEAVVRNKVDQPLNGPAGYQEMTYSFDHENAHFVALNSNHYGEAHKVQRSWLTSDLAATTKPHVFVMAHEPAYPRGPHIGSSLDVYPTERDDFWKIMGKAGVVMYFCGHEHLYSRFLYNGIYQVLNGTCGAPIATGYSGTTAAYQYVVVDINGMNVSVTTKNDSGGVIDSWSYTLIPNCDSVSSSPTGAVVAMKGKIATYASGTTVYLEEVDRSSGFKVVASGVAVGDLVNVMGTVQKSSTGEPFISGSAIVVSSGNSIPKPLGFRVRDLLGSPRGLKPGAKGGNGLNNLGLLVRVFGKVNNPSTGMFYVDDGSGVLDGTLTGTKANVGVRINSAVSVTEGQFVVVTGISSVFKNSAGETQRLIQATNVM